MKPETGPATAPSRPLVTIIDGSGYIFRAFYAIRPLATASGEPTNAVLGFTTMINRVLEDDKPEYIAIAFDPKDKSNFRRDIYPAYKATRPPPPEDLPPQIPRILEVTESFRLPLFRIERYEADDVIATLTRIALEKGCDVRIITGDKDLMQLVGDRVTLWDPMKGKRYQSEDVVEKFGVPPHLVPDVLALAGDSSDNVPGVKGIGEKTAAKLLNEYGDLEALLAAAKSGVVKGKVGETLAASEAEARLSRRLVTLDAHAPMSVELEDLKYPGPDLEVQRELFEELEFRRMIRVAPGAATRVAGSEITPSGEEISHARYEMIGDVKALAPVLEKLRAADTIAIAAETTSQRLADADLIGLAVAWAPGEAAYLPSGHHFLGCPPQIVAPELFRALAPILSDRSKKKVSASLKTLHQLCTIHGVELAGLANDTTIASYLLEPDDVSHDLVTISRRFLGHEPVSRDELLGKGVKKRSMSELAPEEVKLLLAETADLTWRAASQQRAALERAELLSVLEDIELPLIPVLADIELAGVRIDADLLRRMSTRFTEELSRLEKRCYEVAGKEFNIGSPKQLQKILFEELGLRITKRTKTGPSTDASVLEDLAEDHDLPGAILEFRQVQKLKSTYVDALPGMVCEKTGRVHTVLSQSTAATGRLSSTEPNLQNIPIRTELGRELRKAFIAEPGAVLISVDYSQIELRVLAHFSEDPVLMEAFRVGADVHTRTASVLFGVDPKDVTREQRGQAKTVNFGVLYGMGNARLARDLGIPRRVASKFIEDYFERQPGVRRYIETTRASAREKGYVRTLFGRRRYVSDVNSKNRNSRMAAERVASNTPIQGSAADLIKLAMARVHSRLKEEIPDARLILQVHDELLIESPEEKAGAVGELVKREMENAYPLKVPLVAEPHIGKNWDDAH